MVADIGQVKSRNGGEGKGLIMTSLLHTVEIMDLKEFVREALLQVVAGVTEAQHRTALGATINPRVATKWVRPENGHAYEELDQDNIRAANLIATHQGGVADIIEFDVAITVESSDSSTSESEKKREGGLKLHVLSAGIDIQSKSGESATESRSNVSRIKFRVPVQFLTIR
jgi:hypothetical protein